MEKGPRPHGGPHAALAERWPPLRLGLPCPVAVTLEAVCKDGVTLVDQPALVLLYSLYGRPSGIRLRSSRRALGALLEKKVDMDKRGLGVTDYNGMVTKPLGCRPPISKESSADRPTFLDKV